MDSGTWVEVSALIDAFGTLENARENTRRWRGEMGWTLDELARQVNAMDPSVELSRDALHKIERGSRDMKIEEGLALAKAFKKSLAELLLPPEELDWQSEAWRGLRYAADALVRVREASHEYAAQINILRSRQLNQDRLRDFVELESRRANALVRAPGSQAREEYDRSVSAWAALGNDIPEFDVWAQSLEPSPLQVAALHALGRSNVDADHWYLGWETDAVHARFRADKQTRGRTNRKASGNDER